MKALVKTALLSVLFAGCGPEFAVVPRGGVPHETTNASGAYITAFADQWQADPRDLADYVTPIAVDIYNGTGREVRIALADFHIANGDAGEHALDPFSGEYDAGPQASLDLGPGTLYAGPLVGPAGGMLLAARGGGGGFGAGGGFRGSASVRGVRRSGGTRYAGGGYQRRWGGYGAAPRWGDGFRVHAGLRGYYGPGAYYWGGPWALGWGYGYGYYAWGVPGDRYRPSQDVLDEALPEGVLEPAAHINGFLFFRKATAADVKELTLVWQPHDAQTGEPIGDARIVLAVVHR